MNRQINFRLDQEELAAVDEAMHHSPRAEVRQRATAIRMLHLGNKPETVAELLAVAPVQFGTGIDVIVRQVWPDWLTMLRAVVQPRQMSLISMHSPVRLQPTQGHGAMPFRCGLSTSCAII